MMICITFRRFYSNKISVSKLVGDGKSNLFLGSNHCELKVRSLEVCLRFTCSENGATGSKNSGLVGWMMKDLLCTLITSLAKSCSISLSFIKTVPPIKGDNIFFTLQHDIKLSNCSCKWFLLFHQYFQF